MRLITVGILTTSSLHRYAPLLYRNTLPLPDFSGVYQWEHQLARDNMGLASSGIQSVRYVMFTNRNVRLGCNNVMNELYVHH